MHECARKDCDTALAETSEAHKRNTAPPALKKKRKAGNSDTALAERKKKRSPTQIDSDSAEGKSLRSKKYVAPLFTNLKSTNKAFYVVLHRATMASCRFGEYETAGTRIERDGTERPDARLGQVCFTELTLTCDVRTQSHWWTRVGFFHFPDAELEEPNKVKVAEIMNTWIKKRTINCIAGWVGANSSVLGHLSAICPLTGEWPLCQYIKIDGQPHASKLQWLFVNAGTSQDVKYQDVFAAPGVAQLYTALAASKYVWKCINDMPKNGCPICSKRFDDKAALYRHLYPRGKCWQEFIVRLNLGKAMKTALAATALAATAPGGCDDLLRESFIPCGQVPALHQMPPAAIEAWAVDTLSRTRHRHGFWVGRINDYGFQGFKKHIPWSTAESALLAHPDQYSHMIMLGGGTPSRTSQRRQKEQEVTNFSVCMGRSSSTSGKGAEAGPTSRRRPLGGGVRRLNLTPH